VIHFHKWRPFSLLRIINAEAKKRAKVGTYPVLMIPVLDSFERCCKCGVVRFPDWAYPSPNGRFEAAT